MNKKDFYWEIFTMTGSIDVYLKLKNDSAQHQLKNFVKTT